MTFNLTYQPLDQATEELRLIRILSSEPKSTSSNDSNAMDLISCQLTHFSLKDREVQVPRSQLDWSLSKGVSEASNDPLWRYTWGDYAALSYTWGGNDTPNCDIVINGNRVSVRSNLEAALRCLRERKIIQSGLLIWIDALCINQADIQERNHEVKRMRTIYKTACEVVVWLGNEGDNSSKAITLIKALSKAADEESPATLQGLMETLPDVFKEGAWQALGQLMYRPYWERVWIMQEMAMGSPNTPIFCGKDMIEWKDIYQGLYTFGTRNVELFSYIEKECQAKGVAYSGLNRNKVIHLWVEQEVQAGKGNEQLMAMLDLARKSMVTDPKDKIYGLMAMMDQKVAQEIDPDYDKELAEVYISFAKVMISTSR